MDKKEFYLKVQTNAVKGASSSEWNGATVSIDEVGRKILIAYDKLPRNQTAQKQNKAQAPGNHTRHESSSSGSSDGLKTITINLSDFKAPKKKRKKFPPPNLVVGLRSRWPVLRTEYFFCTEDEATFTLFYDTLRQLSDPSGQRRPSLSVNSAATDAARQPPPTPQPGLRPTALGRSLDRLDDSIFLCGGGDYATVEGGEIQYDTRPERFYVESKIYEPFQNSRCFSVHLNHYECRSQVAELVKLRKGDKLQLYLADSELELLAADAGKPLLCSWPFSRIKSFSYLSDIVQLEVGPRTRTGEASISFDFSGNGASSKNVFIAELTARLHAAAAPPSKTSTAAESAPAAEARGHSRSSSESDNADDGLATEDLAANDVYAEVTQPQSQPTLTTPKVPPRPIINGEAGPASAESQQPRRPSVPAADAAAAGSRPPPPSVPPPPRPPPPLHPTSPPASLMVSLPTPPPTLPKPPPERRHLSITTPTSPTAFTAVSSGVVEQQQAAQQAESGGWQPEAAADVAAAASADGDGGCKESA